MEIIKHTEKFQAGGMCAVSPWDTYFVELSKERMYLGLGNDESELSADVIILPKDAIELARHILKYYGEGK